MPAASLHLQQGLAVQSKRRPGQQHLSDSSLPQCRHPLRHGTPYQQLCRSAPASSCATAPWPAKAPPRRPIASNKPHPAEKSTPVWLAIWRTWAGFANSQLRCATFHSTYSYKCTSSLLPTWRRCSDRRKSIGPSAPIAYAISVSPPNEAVAWPVAQVLIGDMAAVWLGCCSSNSPRARILVLGTSGAHWPARWPQFELTERVAKS